MNKSRVYVCINGLEIEYPEPAPPLARFLQRAEKALEDPRVTYAELLVLVFSVDNPLMEASPILGATASRETISHPVYRVLKDMTTRKQLAERGGDISKLSRGYTLTVAEAADRLGAHESTVRKAIREGRLACWVKDGVHYLSPKWTDQFKLATEKSRDMTEEPSRTRAAGAR